MNRAERRRRGQRGPNPLRVPPPPIAGRAEWPPVATSLQWCGALLMVFAGLLLTALWIGLFNWSKQRPSVPRATIVSVQSAGTPSPVDVAEKTAVNYRLKLEQHRWATRILGFLHHLPSPLFVFLGAVCFQGLERRFGDAGIACTRVATVGMVLCSLGCMMITWRVAYVPLVDWIWEACGGEMVDYERPDRSAKLGGRRTGGNVNAAYSTGIYAAVAVWIFLGWVHSRLYPSNDHST